jgi:hypothetical protein
MNWKSIRHAKWFIPVVVGLATMLIAGAVFAAVSTISNLWTSPTITVTTVVPPPPSNSLLQISSDLTAQTVSTGVTIPVNVTLVNPSAAGAPGYTGVTVQFTVNGTGIVPADVVLQYSDGTNWYAIPLTQNGNNSLSGVFGPASGFAVPTGYNATTPFRVTFSVAGSYTATAQAVQN